MSEQIYAIDVTSCPVRPTGIGNYVYQLVNALKRLELGSNERLLVFGRSDQVGRAELSGAEFVDCGLLSVPKRLLWEQLRFPAMLKKHRVTVVHSPNYTVPIMASCKRLTTIHDLTCFLYPHRRKFVHALFFRNMIRYSVKHADHVIAVSTNTKNDIKRILHTQGGNISVVFEGANAIYRNHLRSIGEPIIRALGIRLPYFLFIGTLEPSKNIERLIRGFIQFRKKTGSEMQLVLAGKPGWGFDQILSLIKSDDADMIKHVGYQPDDSLVALYNGALAFVYPSLYEGFGIPLLESMACGTPVLCSNISSLPEVAGDAALMFNPYSETAIAEAMQTMAADESLRTILIQCGFSRINSLNWENAARQTLAIYRSLAA